MLNAFWKESSEALLRELAIRKERLTAEAERRLSRYGPFSLCRTFGEVSSSGSAEEAADCRSGRGSRDKQGPDKGFGRRN